MDPWRKTIQSWLRKHNFGTYPTNDKIGTSINKLTEGMHYVNPETGREIFKQNLWFILFENPDMFGITIECRSKMNYEEDTAHNWCKDSFYLRLSYEELDKIHELSRQVRSQYDEIKQNKVNYSVLN